MNNDEAIVDPLLPHEAEIVERIQNSRTIFTIRLQFTDPEHRKRYSFHPGQFNMLYLYGVGEAAISIVSDPEDEGLHDHTIRIVGRVTKGLAKLKEGDRIGIRGPFGRGWPIEKVLGKDIVIVTGGLGCASAVSVLNYIMQRHKQFGKIKILQGIKHSDDMIFRERYSRWEKTPDTEVFIAADESGPQWPFYTGRVTGFIERLDIDFESAFSMMCGPEGMIEVAAQALIEKNMSEDNIFVSMERNMHCAIGHCGHCQYGGSFICKDGPVFPYSKIKSLFHHAGF